MTKCPACQSDLVTIMDLGEFALDETIPSYNAICGKCSNRFVEMVYSVDMEDVNKGSAPNKATVYTEKEINELAARCEGHTPDGAVTEANLHLEIAAPSLLDTCQYLVEQNKVLREALSNALAHMCGVPLPIGADDIRAQATAALLQVQDGGGK